MKFKPSRYTYVINEDNKRGIPEIIAISSYAGKTVRGVARCSPTDNYDVEAGKELAAARCNQKVAQKRVKRAMERQAEAHQLFREIKAYMTEMDRYYCDAVNSMEKAKTHLNDILDKM